MFLLFCDDNKILRLGKKPNPVWFMQKIDIHTQARFDQHCPQDMGVQSLSWASVSKPGLAASVTQHLC